MPDTPIRPCDPRDEPHYIDADCPSCGTALALYDAVYETDGPIWYDEWVCPVCEDGVHLDVPASYWDRIEERSEAPREKYVPLEDTS